MAGDVALGADGQPWEVVRVDHRHVTNRITCTHHGKSFTFTPEHVLPVQRKRGDVGKALDILTAAFPGLEILR